MNATGKNGSRNTGTGNTENRAKIRRNFKRVKGNNAGGGNAGGGNVGGGNAGGGNAGGGIRDRGNTGATGATGATGTTGATGAIGATGNINEPAAETSTADQILVLAEQQPPPGERRGRGRPPGRKSASSSRDASEIAGVIVDLMEIIGSQLSGLGDLGKLTPDERALLTPALSRTIARLNPDHINRMQKFSDPLLILSAFAMYGSRIIITKRTLSAQPVESETKPTSSTSPISNNGSDTIIATPPENLTSYIGQGLL